METTLQTRTFELTTFVMSYLQDLLLITLKAIATLALIRRLNKSGFDVTTKTATPVYSDAFFVHIGPHKVQP